MLAAFSSTRPHRLVVLVVLPVVLSGLGCTGLIGEGASGAEPEGTIAPLPPSTEPVCENGSFVSADLRLLTAGEYDRSLSELLGEPVTAIVGVLGDGSVDERFTSNAGVLMDDETFAQYEIAARALARRGMASGRIETTCAGELAECLSLFLADFAQEAYRRPLSPAETAAFTIQFNDRMTEGDTFGEAIGVIASTVLVSPQMLYHAEIGVALGDGRARLTPFEVVSRLSFFLWGQAPSSMLLEMARAGALENVAGIEAVARQMLEDPRAALQIDRFLAEWTGSQGLNGSVAASRGLSEQLVEQMVQERARFAESLLFGSDPSISHLLTGTPDRLGGALAAHYGLIAGPSEGNVQVPPSAWQGQPRSGIFTQGAFLLSMSVSGDAYSPTSRGRVLREQVLCQEVSDPPPEAEQFKVTEQEGLTTRELSEVNAAMVCATACHSVLNPLGFSLENFDAVAAYRETEVGKPIDASDDLTGTDNDGAFQDAHGLFARLDEGTTAEECITEKWASFALQTSASPALACLASEVSARSEGSIPDLLIALVTHDSFLFRRTCQ